jgi:hypothetical protein
MSFEIVDFSRILPGCQRVIRQKLSPDFGLIHVRFIVPEEDLDEHGLIWRFVNRNSLIPIGKHVENRPAFGDLPVWAVILCELADRFREYPVYLGGDGLDFMGDIRE